MSASEERGHEPVYLRSLEMDDLPKIHQWHNDLHLYEILVGEHGHVSRSAVEQWLRGKTAFSRNERSWAICISESHEHIGNIYLKEIDWVARHARLSMFIGDPAHRSKGYGRVAVRLMTEHAFKCLGLLRVHLIVLADNEPAIRAYKKCGFQTEGRLRRHAYVNGQFRDMQFMGLCADDKES